MERGDRLVERGLESSAGGSLIFRPRRQHGRTGVDGIATVVICLIGVAGLVIIAA
ncbi:hypothetical protein [Streptomyces sp. NPDC093260]|uniref:hypothetical protein n=1 Tax=Streptomyces sp. NPDC093260 TaxID=3155073 RepID=UPI00341B8194